MRPKYLIALGVVCVGTLAVAGTTLIAAGSRTHAAKPQVLPSAAFSVQPEQLPPPPTAPAVPLHANKGAAGGTTVPRPCRTPLLPAHIVIARLCIDARIVPATTTPRAGLTIPADVHQVGLWAGGAAITRRTAALGRGTTLIAGHVDNHTQGPGAFHDLYLVQPGEVISTVDADGSAVRWRAISLDIYPKASLPASVWAGHSGPRRLVLVTCGGPVLHIPGSGGTYADNVVVTAVPA